MAEAHAAKLEEIESAHARTQEESLAELTGLQKTLKKCRESLAELTGLHDMRLMEYQTKREQELRKKNQALELKLENLQLELDEIDERLVGEQELREKNQDLEFQLENLQLELNKIGPGRSSRLLWK